MTMKMKRGKGEQENRRIGDRGVKGGPQGKAKRQPDKSEKGPRLSRSQKPPHHVSTPYVSPKYNPSLSSIVSHLRCLIKELKSSLRQLFPPLQLS